jgi:hypothetical protein
MGSFIGVGILNDPLDITFVVYCKWVCKGTKGIRLEQPDECFQFLNSG